MSKTEENLKAAFAGWAEDGQSFFITTTERNQTSFDLYRYSTDDYSREMVFENPLAWTVGLPLVVAVLLPSLSLLRSSPAAMLREQNL